MSLYDLDKRPFVLVIILVFFAFTIICLGEVWETKMCIHEMNGTIAVTANQFLIFYS